MSKGIEKMEENESNLLDLDQIIASKFPVLKKFLPGFVLTYLKRIIHQDKLNYYLTEYKDQYGVDFIDSVLKKINTKLDLVGLENIPKTGKCLVASNHPLGGLDGMALMLAVSHVRKDIIFPVNDLLMNVKNLQVMFIPINKHGSNTENIKILNKNFDSDKLLCYFPAGMVSRKQNGKIRDLFWRSTFITKGKRYKRDIIPTHISGQNTNFFYNLANIRKAVGLKANLEMLYLVDEFHRQGNNTLRITFGERIPYQTFDDEYTKEEWSALMREYTYKLGEGFQIPFPEWISNK